MTGAVAVTTAAGGPPALPPEISTCYLPVQKRASSGDSLIYMPYLYGSSRVRFVNTKLQLDEQKDLFCLTPITDEIAAVDWDQATATDIEPGDLEKSPEEKAMFHALPSDGVKSKSYASWSKGFADWIYTTQKLELLQSPGTGIISKPDETERDFRIRLQQSTREMRDEAAETLQKKYATKIATLEERIRKAEQAVDREKDQAKQAGFQTAISLGSTILGAFTGRKIASKSNLGKVATAARGAGRTSTAQQDVTRARETLETYQKQLENLKVEFDTELEKQAAKIDPAAEELASVAVNPRKTDIQVQVFTLAWAPFWKSETGIVTPAFTRE